MTGADLSFIEPAAKRRAAEETLRRLPAPVAEAFSRSLYRHPERYGDLLRLAKDARVALALATLGGRISPAGEAAGGARSLLALVLGTLLWPPQAPSKAEIKARLAKRHEAATHIRKAFAALQGDDAVTGLSAPEVLRHGQKSDNDSIRGRATRALCLIHEADGDLEGNLMHAAFTLGDTLCVLADIMGRDQPMNYADRTREPVPIPQDGRRTRDRLWVERTLEATFRSFTGGPQYDVIATLEGVALGADADADGAPAAEEVKDRLGDARRPLRRR